MIIKNDFMRPFGKPFKPMLLPNKLVTAQEIPLGDYLVSTKLDGIRTEFAAGEMVSRSLKPIRNKQLQEKYQWLKDYSEKNDCLIDGEMYAHNVSFQMISSLVMTEDFLDGKKFNQILKNSTKELTQTFTEKDRQHAKDLLVMYNEEGTDFNNPLEYFAFDFFSADFPAQLPFYFRKEQMMKIDGLIIHPQTIMVFPKDTDWLIAHYNDAVKNDYEGLIVKSKQSPYKFGRATINEGHAFKFKEFLTEDFEIIDVIQATQVREGAEKKINELGGSVTSKKKDDRVLINKASAFMCRWNGNDFKVSIAEPDTEKQKIWMNKEKYIGEFVECKFMLIGSKDGVPRHGTTLRMRYKKDDE